jgi:hypothetical protein
MKMAKAKNTDAAMESVTGPSTFTLKKNHGLVNGGRADEFYPAGKEFNGDSDKDLIHRLIKSGASLQETTGATFEK